MRECGSLGNLGELLPIKGAVFPESGTPQARILGTSPLLNFTRNYFFPLISSLFIKLRDIRASDKH